MHTVKYFNLVGDEDDIGTERFKWSCASIFSYNRKVIGLAVADASAIRTHLSVHGTAHPTSAASVWPQSAANCLIRSAVDICHPRQQRNPPAGSSVASDPVRSVIINGLGAGSVGRVAILRCPLAGLLALFSGLLSLLLSLCAKHRIVAPLRVSRLAVPHFALMLTTRRPMYARMSSLQTDMLMYARALQ